MHPARRRATPAAATAVVLAATGGLLTAVAAAPASAAPTCTSPVYKRQFYANTSFTGTPKKTDCDSAVDENWGSGAPASGLPANNFGVRWTVTRDFGSGGPFSFAASSRDGIRVYVDGTRKVDLWKNVSTTVSKTVNLTVPAGKHTLRVDFVNWTGVANVKFSYAPRTSATVDKVRPLTPTGVTVTHDKATNRAKVTWAKNKEMDLAGYRVYRRLKGAAYPARPLTTTTSTSYTDTTLPKTGATYYYEVRAYDKAGNESSGTADQAVTTVDTTAPSAPTGVAGNWRTGDVTEVRLWWNDNPEPDVAGYRVYRSATYPVALTAANRVSGSALVRDWSETLAPTGDYFYYVVTAVDTHGNESAASRVVDGSTPDHTAPTFVAQDLKAVDGERGVTVTWSWNRDTDPDLATFQVYRDGAPVDLATGYFFDGELERSTDHTYYVRAIDDDRNFGPASAPVTVHHVGDYTAPGAVNGLTATAQENGVRLDWDDSTADDVHHYEIHRGVFADGAWTYTNITADMPYGTVWSENRDANLPDGERLRYVVVAVDKDGNALDPATSTSVEVAELDLVPPETYPDDTANLSVETDDAAQGPMVRVIYSDYRDPHGTATGYHVYRWDRATGAYVRLTDAPVPTDDSYTDLTAPTDTTVFYKVTTAYADGTESEPAGDHVLRASGLTA
ncbi:PA14 domain-containing protein [Streptomyces sp. NPDC002888]|uniref:PA14 domain-containing protein n=1 Tax=Streptomyces sp. NPDC002888 TaxID=3364668 RepID=UPI00369F984F